MGGYSQFSVYPRTSTLEKCWLEDIVNSEWIYMIRIGSRMFRGMKLVVKQERSPESVILKEERK